MARSRGSTTVDDCILGLCVLHALPDELVSGSSVSLQVSVRHVCTHGIQCVEDMC